MEWDKYDLERLASNLKYWENMKRNGCRFKSE